MEAENYVDDSAYPVLLKENPMMDPHPDYITPESEYRDFYIKGEDNSPVKVNQEIQLIRHQSSMKKQELSQVHVTQHAVGPSKISSQVGPIIQIIQSEPQFDDDEDFYDLTQKKAEDVEA